MPARNSASAQPCVAAKRASFGLATPGIGVDQAVGDRERGARVVHHHDGAAHAAVAHQHVAAEARRSAAARAPAVARGTRARSSRSAGRYSMSAGRRRASSCSARASASRSKRAAQAGRRRGSRVIIMPSPVAAARLPIEPAPIVSTTSPSRAMPRSVAGTSAMSSTNTGSTLPATRKRARQRAAVGRDDRRFARRIDLGQHQRVGGRQHAHEILEQVARARVAMRLEREHEAAARESSRARRRAWPPSRPDDGRSRRSA